MAMFRPGWLTATLLAYGCVGLGPEALQSPVDDGSHPRPQTHIPEAAKSRPSPVTPPTDVCDEAVANASGVARRDFEALCQAQSHDGECVGYACERTAPREAFECLLEDGHGATLASLAGASEPALRAYGREALERTNSWTLVQVEQALADTATTPATHGCIGRTEQLVEAGLTAALRHPDRAAIAPALRTWAAAKPSPPMLARALMERGGEPWIATSRLRTLMDDRETDAELRAAAALGLALRRQSVSKKLLVAFTTHSRGDVRLAAVRALDAAGAASAWSSLKSLRNDPDTDVTEAWLAMGAHHDPQRAAPIIDAYAAEAWVVPTAAVELPSALFTTRARAEMCRYANHTTGSLPHEPSKLIDALAALPARKRCSILSDTRACEGGVGSPATIVLALDDALAAQCKITGKPATLHKDWALPGCNRTALKLERKSRAGETKRKGGFAAR